MDTYVRTPPGPEVGRVRMLAECDLGHVLYLPAEERRTVILDNDLRKGYRCLTFSLYHMHSSGIIHKGIKPRNVNIRNSQLMFTDFGASDDFQEGSNAGSKKYKAPEYRMIGEVVGQAPADVFSLSLVLLSVWSTLEGWHPADREHFPNLTSSSPFHKNMPKIHAWVQDRLERRIQLTRISTRNKF